MNETQRMYEAMRIVDANDGLLTYHDSNWSFFQYESDISHRWGISTMTTNVEWDDEGQRFESF